MAVTGGGAEGGDREEEAEESTGGVRDIRSRRRSRRNGSTQVNRGSGGGSYYWRIRVLETVCLLVILHIPACSGCNPWEFRCNNGDCIKGTRMCDGEHDCPDLSDELDCPSHAVTVFSHWTPAPCHSGQFQCNNHRCIYPGWKCDGQDDCGDGSDEIDCPTRHPPAAMSLGSIVGLSIAIAGLLIIVIGVVIMLTCVRRKNIMHARQMTRRANRFYHDDLPFTVSGMSVFDRQPPPRYEVSHTDVSLMPSSVYNEHLTMTPPPYYSSQPDVTQTAYCHQILEPPPRYTSRQDLSTSGSTDDPYPSHNQSFTSENIAPVHIYQNPVAACTTLHQMAAPRDGDCAITTAGERERSNSKDLNCHGSKENVFTYDSRECTDRDKDVSEGNKSGFHSQLDVSNCKTPDSGAGGLKEEEEEDVEQEAEMGFVRVRQSHPSVTSSDSSRSSNLVARSRSMPVLPSAATYTYPDTLAGNPVTNINEELKIHLSVNLHEEQIHPEVASPGACVNGGEIADTTGEVQPKRLNQDIQESRNPSKKPRRGVKKTDKNRYQRHPRSRQNLPPASILEQEGEEDAINERHAGLGNELPRYSQYSLSCSDNRSVKTRGAAHSLDTSKRLSQSMSVLFPGPASVERNDSFTSVTSWNC